MAFRNIVKKDQFFDRDTRMSFRNIGKRDPTKLLQFCINKTVLKISICEYVFLIYKYFWAIVMVWNLNRLTILIKRLTYLWQRHCFFFLYCGKMILELFYLFCRHFGATTNWGNCPVQGILFVATNFRGFYKMQWFLGSWICGFKHYRQPSTGKLYSVRTPRFLMISQYSINLVMKL
jgi:hypothetical protein